ncbi:MAG TPA: ATP-binding protein, partial [Blastocatellia bacterium]|nr:ATP-binding protein [Blastocatellia bacterium]
RHGIAQRERDGCIEIHAKREQDILSLQVKDNGPGYAFDKSSVNSNGNGLGLINIRERLKKLYGDRQRFEMSDTTEGGVSVTLTIPFVESEPHTE